MTSIYSPQLFSKLSSEWYLATALYDAIDDGNLREVSILLRDKHADPNVIIPDYDITPFHLAVGHENQLFAKEVTKLLLKNGGDPNVKDTEGVTPLHVAAVWNRPTIVRLLLTYGGDPTITDDSEKNAFHHAYEEHAWETLKTLEIHRRAQLKKSETTDRSYNIQLDKVIVQGDGVQAEYRPVCEICKKDVAVEKQSVATQTSPPSVTFKTTEIDTDLLDLDNISSTEIRPRCYDWCEQACDVVLTAECKRKITSHRAKGRVYEYNPIFEKRPVQTATADQQITKLSLCCSTVPKTTSTIDVTFPPPEDLIELKQLTVVATTTKQVNGNGEFSEDSLNGAERKAKESFFDTLNVPYIDESSPSSSQNRDTKTSEQPAKEDVQPAAIPDSSVPDQQLKGKHVSWSGCLSTCACIPKQLNESDSSVYFTNPESDVDDKTKKEDDRKTNANGVQKLPTQDERKTESGSVFSGIEVLSQRSSQCVGDITQDRSLISNDRTAPLPYEENSLISNDGEPFANYAGDKPPLKFAVEYKYTDDEDGIEFVEARLPLCISSSNSNSSTPLKERNVQNEQNHCNGRRIEEHDTSDSAAYDTDYIRTELKKLGFVSGPIAGTTKKLYLKKLRRIRKYAPDIEEPILKPIFSAELEYVLREDNDDWEKIITKWSSLETELQSHFSDASLASSWRSGSAKTSFTYLLLDPRISDNLPARCERMDLGDVWRDFIHAIFYVGKGTRARPYEHLHEAFLVWKETKAYPRKRCNLKVRHILDIWKEGLGVVCLTVFHNVISADAHTREAAMIDAIGLPRLKNEKAGVYYGVAANWNSKLKRRLGTYLLYRAMRMFIADNEVQLKPTDVR